ncbi:hypothetical protein JX266_012074 [Neoarthrinium moseri]|nr:hypothetical protein JX266_012074 [Neoarthrinium moseri]
MSIFLDFDGTITVNDTIGELAAAALRIQSERGIDLDRQWDAVVKAYLDDYNRHAKGYHAQESARCRPEHEVAFLRAGKAVELRSLDRINACAVFKGISADELRRAGREAVASGRVRLRPGFRAFLDRRLRESFRVFVISVNWSTAFIEGALDHPGVRVIANHVREDGTVVGPELLNGGADAPLRNLTNSCDKLDVMRAVMEEDPRGPGLCSYYFGDSITDLECLLHATSGIVVSDTGDSKLLETLRRIGEDVPRSSEVSAETSASAATPNKCAWAADYNEVTEHILFRFKHDKA